MMKKAFTLVEILISVLLASLIFYYSYNVIDSTKNNHKVYKNKSEKVLNSSVGFSLLYKDLQNSMGEISVNNGRNYDSISFYSKNSLYGMKYPYIQYFVSKKDKAFVRVENKNGFDVFSIGSSVEQTLPVMYSEVIFENCLSFRVNAQEKIIDVMLRNEEADMLFKVYTGSK